MLFRPGTTYAPGSARLTPRDKRGLRRQALPVRRVPNQYGRRSLAAGRRLNALRFPRSHARTVRVAVVQGLASEPAARGGREARAEAVRSRTAEGGIVVPLSERRLGALGPTCGRLPAAACSASRSMLSAPCQLSEEGREVVVHAPTARGPSRRHRGKTAARRAHSIDPRPRAPPPETCRGSAAA